MSQILQEIEKGLPSGMHIPNAIKKLLAWVEDNQFYIETPEGLIGYLYSPDDEPKGTEISFLAQDPEALPCWFEGDISAVLSRLYLFCCTGADGSAAGIWLDGSGNQKYVHLGTNNSGLTCVISYDPVDFIRLLAIGYDEISCGEELLSPPVLESPPNEYFQNWVVEEFGVAIPRVANEVVESTATIFDEDPTDPFCRWVIKQNA